MFNTIRAYLSISFVTIVFGTIAIILSQIKRNKIFDYAVRPWGKYILKGCGVRLLVEGEENLPKEPCIIMYNHSSSFDIYAFCAGVPFEWKAIMKDEVAKIPFVGWVCRLTGQYFVSRDGSAGDLETVKEIAEKVKHGPSVLVAPEGTRSEDGNLLPFKKGGFVIALRAKVPVVTMVITGGRDIKPKKSRMIKPGVMKIRYFEPIYIDKLGKGRQGREKLENLVRDQMQSVLKEEQKLRMAI
jgi:1-acyl-sn-glycerol-3-phosphate acyltransferase